MPNNTLSLRYDDEPLSSLTFNGSAELQQTFDPVECFPPLPIQEKTVGVTLNGIRYSHTLYQHLRFDFIIGADELSSGTALMGDAKEFVRKFFLAQHKYISYPTGADYLEVVSEQKEMPVSYMENLIYLPEIAFSLFTRNPVSDTTMNAIGLKPLSVFYP